MPSVILPRLPFIVIRHGETDANRDGWIAGRIEAQLTQPGCAAAQDLARWQWPAEIALFVSPQKRARQTAQLAFPNRQFVTLDGLRERDWGVFEGRPLAQAPPRETTPEAGEAWADMIARVAAAITQAQEMAAGAHPVLVAHSGVIRAARHLTCGSAHGPSPVNTTPYLFAPHADSWRETLLRGTEARAPGRP